MLPPGDAPDWIAESGATSRVAGVLRRAGGLALDALLPPCCMRCGCVVATAGSVCGACWSALTFLGPPWCACCGLPFEHDQGPDGICGACTRQAPVFDRCRAALRYDDESRGIILAFKHRRSEEHTSELPSLMR